MANFTIPEDAGPGVHLYRLRSTGASSAKFGPCEVCGGHCPEVFIQAEGVTCSRKGVLRVTYAGCVTLFGHESCLAGVRRAGA